MFLPLPLHLPILLTLAHRILLQPVDYLKRTDLALYQSTIARLGLRR